MKAVPAQPEITDQNWRIADTARTGLRWDIATGCGLHGSISSLSDQPRPVPRFSGPLAPPESESPSART